MDFLNKGKELLSGNGNNTQNQNQNQNQNTNQAGGDPNAAPQQQGGSSNTGGEDYGDKALDFIEKKSGHTFSRDQNEKITDGARGFYEKQTGNKVDSKYSN